MFVLERIESEVPATEGNPSRAHWVAIQDGRVVHKADTVAELLQLTREEDPAAA